MSTSDRHDERVSCYRNQKRKITQVYFHQYLCTSSQGIKDEFWNNSHICHNSKQIHISSYFCDWTSLVAGLSVHIKQICIDWLICCRNSHTCSPSSKQLVLIRRSVKCDILTMWHVWRHIFTKEPQSLVTLQAQLVHNPRAQHRKSYNLLRLQCKFLSTHLIQWKGHITNLAKLLTDRSCLCTAKFKSLLKTYLMSQVFND